MFTGTFSSGKFLRSICDTEPFRDYCALRDIAFAPDPVRKWRSTDLDRWQRALLSLPESERARVETEFAQVNAMAHAHAQALLLTGMDGGDLPPDTVPSGPALALWFFLHHGELFQEAFLQHEVEEVGSWRAARAPAGIALTDLPARQAALAAELQEFFHVREGTGRFCAVEAHELEAAICFFAHVSDRLRLFDAFTADGSRTMQAARPAFPVMFAYYPADGRLLLKSRQRARDRVIGLLQCFGRSVLGVELDERCLCPAFRLDVFKRRFEPPLDAADMEMVRVKALHLLHPEREGRRRVKLETLARDGQFAILDLLREHGGGEGVLDGLDVLYAELQLRLRENGRSRNHVVRLWPDRSNLNQTPLGERLRACLRRWGISYAD